MKSAELDGILEYKHTDLHLHFAIQKQHSFTYMLHKAGTKLQVAT